MTNHLRIHARTAALLLAVVPALAITGQAAAQDTPPEKASGLSGTAEAVGTVDLAPHQLQGSIADYDLRSRNITIAPGGAINSHPHAGRPGIVRVTKGTVVEYRGAASRMLKAGDSWYENADTVHWFRNPSSTEPAELWVVDLVPKKK